MSNSHPRRLNGLFGKRAPKERRPAGISRRQKRQFVFEPLEDRRVMADGSGGTGTGWSESYIRDYVLANSTALSTNTTAGAAAVLANENYWNAMIAAASPAQARTSFSIPTDPLLANQWHLINTGQEVGSPDWQPIYGVPGNDVNVAPVWMMRGGLGYTGAGVNVAVIDSGVQTNHPDLAANISKTIPGYNVAGSGSNANPTPNQDGGPHGTAVAGIIAAVANNGIGGTGIAPGASIIPIRFLAPTLNQNATVDAFRYRIQDIDITNNSWGSAAERTLSPLSTAEVNALRDSIIFGRGGLGVIHVFASGNSAGSSLQPGFGGATGNDSSIYDGFQNSRYTITVGGYDHDGMYVNEDGTITGYPEAGPNVLVVAPTGSNANQQIADDQGIGSGIYTTDLTGTYTSGLGGYNVPPHPTQGEIYDRDFLPDGNYTSRFNGTSASAPMVTGVIALMLEANPNLSWRDVQEILVRSARQVSPLEEPTDGSGDTTQNTWFVNQQGFFQEPDEFDASIPGFLQVHFPTLDPVMNQPLKMTNGAGYTVSQGYGTYGEQIGYAHGAVDAEMAVQLAEQWSTKGQTLKPERTFTTSVNGPAPIQAASKGNQASNYVVVPGGFGTGGVGIEYWNEYFADDPFSADDPPVPTRGSNFIEFSVPENNRMSVETVEVKLSISGGTAAALDNMRLVLVSPTGTHSELNHFWYGMGNQATYQNEIPGQSIGSPGSGDNGGNLIWSFTTNRSWGELTDDAPILDPLTGEPLTDPDTGEPTGETKGWRLYMENWSPTTFGMSISMSWHGQQVAASAQRVQGAVGIDDNGDGEFNWTRVITTPVDFDQDPDTLRIFELNTVADTAQERFAGNVTVVAKRTSDGVIAAQFVTGADGNYYFDLAPGEYEISVVDPLGRSALVDTLTVTNDENVKGVNFLLDPGTTASPEAKVAGNVLADLNGDGIKNGDDVAASGITVYVDANRNGAYDAGELTAVTDANGNYEIIVPNITSNTVVDVRVQMPTGWTAVTPVNAMTTLLLRQGVSLVNVNYALKPPANGGGGGGGGVDPATPATILGYVYGDANQNRTRDAGEVGMAGVFVYLDANNDLTYNPGEASTITSSQGAYTFSVFAGAYRVRVVTQSPVVQTAPANNASRVVSLAPGGTVTGVAFGIFNSANYDFGDLPTSYETVIQGATSVLNPAKHKKSEYRLGANWDGELAANPSVNADGDDTTEYDDDDGIVMDPIIGGATVRLVATANRYNGYLKGWIDWNNNGTFDANERLVFSGIGAATDNVLLQQGANTLYIQVPAGVTATQVYARFRYGEYSTVVTSETPVAGAINTPYGIAQVGEVEDYRFAVTPTVAPALAALPSDYNKDNRVDGSDFLAWQRGFGKTSQTDSSNGDGNRDGKVDGSDLTDWKADFGSNKAVAAAAAASATDSTVAPALTASEETVAPTFAPAFSSVVSAATSTLPSALSSNATVRDEAAGRFESRPMLAALAGKLTDVADRLRNRADKLEDRADDAREFVVEWLTGAADRVDNFDFETVRRDRAFDDLFGSRRRQGLRAEHAEDAGDELESDEAFAMFADHLEVPRG
ncbi:S8 family serine peptidase [Lacipirellula sp.]|uniref:S8 family serine peptidase n=1 Tax=Lacipirellula sp. TaxID=2691419 RepID=UPI003D0E8514